MTWRVADIDLERGFVFVKPNAGRLKTAGSEAPVPIPDALGVALRSWLPRCGSDWVIPCVGRLSPWLHGQSERRPVGRLKAAGKAVGVDGFTPLSLRHSLATHLAGWWGLSPRQVQLVLRHTTEATQGYYVHPDLANLRETVRAVDFA